MIDKIKLQTELAHFTGSEEIYYNPLFPNYRYTEGVKFLAQQAKCYWLLDFVFGNQNSKKIKRENFQVLKLKVAKDKTAVLSVSDGDNNQIDSFKLSFTDFPLEQIDIWFIDATLLLPSEY